MTSSTWVFLIRSMATSTQSSAVDLENVAFQLQGLRRRLPPLEGEAREGGFDEVESGC